MAAEDLVFGALFSAAEAATRKARKKLGFGNDKPQLSNLDESPESLDVETSKDSPDHTL